MRTTIRNTLAADGTLSNLMTGGIYAVNKISRSRTPDVFDACDELQPCLNVKLETESPYGPHEDSSVVYVAIQFYEFGGTNVIDQARIRVYQLLHRQEIAGLATDIRHTDDILDQEDMALHCDMAVSRYQLMRSART
jgi:hypothetical protein